MAQGIVGFGESVVDFIPVGTDDGCTIYKACPGGSVANLTVVAARLGTRSAFIGGVGKDQFGTFLQERIRDYGVDTSSMVQVDECGTNLTFVHILEEGQREYSAVNRPGADKMVSSEQIDREKIWDYQVLHVSSNAMASDKTRLSQPVLLQEAKARGMVISYDVNYRPAFYSSGRQALEVLSVPLRWADIVKVTEEELTILTGGCQEENARVLLDQGVRLVLLTKGDQGSDYFLSGCRGHVPAYLVKEVDTTGAGDCFLGGFLSWMIQHGDLKNPEETQVRRAVEYGSLVAALSIQKAGAMSSIPTQDEVLKIFAAN